MKVFHALITIIVLFMLYIQHENINTDVSFVTANNGLEYLVDNRQTQEEQNKSAELLSIIHQRIQLLKEHVIKNCPEDSKHFIDRLNDFDVSKISENTNTSKYTAYSLNKGQEVVFCLRSRKEDGELHKPNLMMFVALHELAHIISISIGHTKEFYKNFRYLIDESVKLGIYDEHNFSKEPKEYCGLTITSNPS